MGAATMTRREANTALLAGAILAAGPAVATQNSETCRKPRDFRVRCAARPGWRTTTAGSLSSCIVGFLQSWRFSQSSGPRPSCVGIERPFTVT